ncbi:MAG: triple tyrosine motif-containing protein [Candidatus Sulfotelmatobacter sp.]
MAEIVSQASHNNSQVYDITPYRFAFLVDREGSVWIGDQKGVHRFSYSPLMELALPTNVDAFALVPEEGGVVWVSAGNRNGSSNLYRVAGGKVELRKSQGGVANFAYRAGDKTLWFGGEGGLWHLVNGTLTRIDLPPALAEGPQYLQTIIQDRFGGMWVSFGSRALYRFADDTWTVNGGHHDLPTLVVISEFTDNLGRVWFGGLKNQLAVLDGDRVQTFGPNEGIRVGAITAIHGRGSGIWIGGEFGLQQFDRGRFHNIEAVDKEWLRGISGIVETTNGDLWLNGLRGVVHVRQSEILEALKNPAHQVSGERFGRREGLPGLPPQLRPIPTAIEGTDGRLWFTGSDGVVWLDPARASNRTPPPPVTIESVSADDQGYRVDLPIRFPAHTSSVQITYAAVSLADPEAIRFRYKVREIDRDWHEAETSTSVSYRNLPPGSYHFFVNTSDTNGLWSDNTATAEFTVLPAFYQTNWFRSLCATVFLALLWAAYQLRVRQLHKQFAMTLEARVGERTRIARDLHDTLLQSFHGLLLRFQTVSQLLPERSEAKEKLDSAIEQAAEAITEGRDAVQGLRDSTVQGNDLALAISTLGEELAADSTNHRPAFRVAVEGESRNLHPILRDETYKIAAEALRNAFRHSRARQIEAEIRYDTEQFRLRVRDDGKGVDPAILSSQGSEGHFGLPGMRERATLIGGKLVVWSEVDAGTEVELRVPASTAYATAQRHSWFSRKAKA